MKRLRRLLLVLTVAWAMCCLWGGVSADRGLEGKDVLTAFLPLAFILLCRFVIFGSPRPLKP